MIEYDKALVRARIIRPWVWGEYAALDKWIMQCDSAVWDYGGGGCFMNGESFYSYILFDSAEDLLACKLAFPDIVMVGNYD